MLVPDDVRGEIERIVGRRPRAWRAVSGGCSPAGRARVETEDGTRVFAKWAVDEGTARGLREEWRVYGALAGDFMPRVVGFADEPTLLVIEDLGDYHWPPPWRPGQARRAADTLRRVHASAAPDSLPRLESYREFLTGWKLVAEDPAPFLSLGLASDAWLAAALPALREAEAAVVLDGEDLLHFDARGDNLCFAGDRRAVLVDWNWACVGNGAVDLAFMAASVHADGGPAPETLVGHAGHAAVLGAGFWASRAGLPPPEGAPAVRALQLHCLRAALPWAARVLDLPRPA